MFFIMESEDFERRTFLAVAEVGLLRRERGVLVKFASRSHLPWSMMLDMRVPDLEYLRGVAVEYFLGVMIALGGVFLTLDILLILSPDLDLFMLQLLLTMFALGLSQDLDLGVLLTGIIDLLVVLVRDRVSFLGVWLKDVNGASSDI